MSMCDVFAEINAVYAARVEAATWGHLAPKPATYSATVVFVWCPYSGSLEPLHVDVQGLDDSPWLFDDVQELIAAHKGEEGTVYRFNGTYRKCKNGKAQWRGRITAIDLGI